jgi:hypothetical protein
LRNCSFGGISISNGSDGDAFGPSKFVLLEYCATSTGLSAMISDLEVMTAFPKAARSANVDTPVPVRQRFTRRIG